MALSKLLLTPAVQNKNQENKQEKKRETKKEFKKSQWLYFRYAFSL